MFTLNREPRLHTGKRIRRFRLCYNGGTRRQVVNATSTFPEGDSHERDSLENDIQKFPGFDLEFFQAAEANIAKFEDKEFRPDIPLLNSVVITGRLGQDPILRHVGSDDSRKLALVTFSVAVQNTFPEPNRGMQPHTSWFDCELWGHRAEIAVRVLRKGLRIGVTGQLGFSTYTSKEGDEIDSPVIMVQTYEILQSRSESEDNEFSRSYPQERRWGDETKSSPKYDSNNFGSQSNRDRRGQNSYGNESSRQQRQWQQSAPIEDAEEEDDGLPF